MPVKFTTISNESLNAMEESLREGVEEYEGTDFPSLFAQFKMYQENRLKINKDSRESKKAARDAEGGGEGRSKRGASAKMIGVVKLVAIEGQENTFKVEKVSIPAPKKEEKEEENLAENPEALAAAVAEAEARRVHTVDVAGAKAQKEAWKKSEAERKKKEGIEKAKATRAAKKQQENEQKEADLTALAEGTYVPRPKKNNLKVVQKAPVVVEEDPEATESEREDDDE